MPRDPEQFEYKTVTRTGKITDDIDKITKVIAYLKAQKARAATLLGKELENLLQQHREIEIKLENVKAEIRPFVEEIFDTKDEAWTRVVETNKVVITMSKSTVRQNFNKDKFIEKISEEFPNLADRFKEIAKECVTVTEVASKLSVDLKNEGIGDVIKNIFVTLKNEIMKIVNKVKNYLSSYDKKLESWKKELEENIIEEENSNDQTTESFKLFYNKYITEANKYL